jgi:heat shock protein HslJ
MRLATWVLSALLLLAGCGGMVPGDKPTLVNDKNLDKLIGRQFELRHMTLDGNRIITHVDAQMTLVFLPEGQAKGFGSVNQFGATYKFSPDGKLTWGKGSFTTTRKAGAPELMDKEKFYLQGLAQTTVAIVARDGLQMQNEDGSTVLVFR